VLWCSAIFDDAIKFARSIYARFHIFETVLLQSIKPIS
jgi:hypothetical protein